VENHPEPLIGDTTRDTVSSAQEIAWDEDNFH